MKATKLFFTRVAVAPRAAAMLAAFMILIGYSGGPADAADGRVVVYPAPPEEPMTPDYQVSVAGQSVPVYMARVAP